MMHHWLSSGGLLLLFVALQATAAADSKEGRPYASTASDSPPPCFITWNGDDCSDFHSLCLQAQAASHALQQLLLPADDCESCLSSSRTI
eukprot:m.37162 g.37162  ORF g.37162 m.37162 type:complete len:90 (+) comp11354_c1_seq1:88-357(+)